VGGGERVTAVGEPSILRELNRLLAEHGFDEFVEAQCRSFYAEKMGRPSLAPGQYSVFCCLATSNAWTRNAPWPGARRTRWECGRFWG